MVVFLTVNTASIFAQGVIDVVHARMDQGTSVVDISPITNCEVELIVKSEADQIMVDEKIDTHISILLPRGTYYIRVTEIGCMKRTQTIEIKL